MTADPVPGPARTSAGPARGHSRVARWAVGLAAGVAVVIVVSYTIFAVAYAAGGEDAVSDNWVGFLGAVALLGGLVVSLAALVLAVAARVRHEQWPLLWLPLALFPVLFTVVVLVETLWIE